MKAISIRQPWAWLVVRPDLTDTEARRQAALASLIKDIENRSRMSHYRGPLLIHAAQGMTAREYGDVSIFLWSRPVLRPLLALLPKPSDLPRGGIVGLTTMHGVLGSPGNSSLIEEHPWHIQGNFGYRLKETRPVPFTPYKGALGLFEVPEHIAQTGATS